MEKKVITLTSEKPGPAFSPALKIDEDWLLLSGQFSTEGDVTDQVNAIFKTAKALFAQAGYDLNDVVRTLCVVVNKEDFADFNKAYIANFPEDAIIPTRSTIVAGLVVPALVEIEFTLKRKK